MSEELTKPLENDVEKEAFSKNLLEGYVKEYKIFIDSTSLMLPRAELFWEIIIPMLKKENSSIILGFRVFERLKEIALDTKDIETANAARTALIRIGSLLKENLISLHGEETDDGKDNTFQVVFTQLRRKHKLLLVTQNLVLARDVLELNNSESVRANFIQVKRINKYGYLSNLEWEEAGEVSPVQTKNQKKNPLQNQHNQEEKRNYQPPNPDEIFEIKTKITSIKDTPVTISHIPEENETVYTKDREEIVLGKKINAGGEGIVYQINDTEVAKIYKSNKITKRHQEKLSRIASKKLNCNGICFPQKLLFNKKKEFVGYTMPLAKGVPLKNIIFSPAIMFARFPGWKKQDTVQLCVTILEKIKYLHDRNIIIGDINEHNIMVVSSTEVYLVDTDSYQIEDLPCPVGTPSFTPPELQGREHSTFLRTMGNENFAVATLLFVIMIVNKLPYAQQDGGNIIENIKNMDFSFPLGEKSNKKTPLDNARKEWSHLKFEIKEAFYNTFTKDGDHSTEQTRYSTDEWLSLFDQYLKALKSGKIKDYDPMSEEIFPTRYKKTPNTKLFYCKICNKEKTEFEGQNDICYECLNYRGEEYKCARCNKTIFYSLNDKLIKKRKKPEYCDICFEYMQQPWKTIVCVDCGESFTLSNWDKEYYTSRRYHLPTHCKECRDAKKYGLPKKKPVVAKRPTVSPQPKPTPPPRKPSTPQPNTPPPTLYDVLTMLWKEFLKPCIKLFFDGNFKAAKKKWKEFIELLVYLIE